MSLVECAKRTMLYCTVFTKSLPLQRGVLVQFPFWWIYYCHSSKSTGKETGKMLLCALVVHRSGVGWSGVVRGWPGVGRALVGHSSELLFNMTLFSI